MNKYEVINELLNYDSIIYETYSSVNYKTCENIINTIIETSIDDILFAIRLYDFQEINSKMIPMFSKFEDCTFNLCLILDSIGQDGASLTDLGRMLLGYDAKDMTFYKYGETHAKTSQLLGLSVLKKVNKKTKVLLSNVGYYYLSNGSVNDKLLNRLIMHTQITRNIIKTTLNNDVKIEKFMECLSETTKIRRLSNVKRVLMELYECKEYDFSQILDKVNFNIGKGE